jgi:molybdopterin adenylyltransferase
LAALVDLSLVVALPGKPSGAVECLGFVAGAIPHAVALAQRKPTTC